MTRVLHIENPAGIAYQLSRGQRSIGIHADVLETWRSPFGHRHDLENYYMGGIGDAQKLLRTILIGRKYDIIHLHTGMPKKRLDVVALRAILGKPLVVHYHGSETRKRYGMYYGSLVDLKMVSTPDLLDLHPGAHFIPNPIEPFPYEKNPNGKIRILHMPTNREIKGTEHLEKVVSELKGRFDFEFSIKEGVTHDEALRQIASAHLVVDEVGDVAQTGVRGRLNVLALEAMMMGRPVVTNLGPELMTYYPGSGVLNVHEQGHSLKERLEEALSHRERLEELGRNGREYVLRNHDPQTVARQVQGLYQEHLRI